jgi:methionyl aminopeptidase
MYTKVKTDKELKALRESCKMAATVLAFLKQQIEPGITGLDINRLANEETKRLGGKPAFLGYQGFPASICVSRNDEVVHGIPTAQVFEAGDLVSMDFGIVHKRMISDTAITMMVGEDTSEQGSVKRKLMAATEESLAAAIKSVKDGCYTGDIGAAAQAVLERNGLGIVRDLVGHGVGHDVHEEPNIPNFGKPGTGDQLQAGMTIAIEPMATLGTHAVVVDPDGWTIRTTDGSLSAHFEHTVLVTESGFEVLTKI